MTINKILQNLFADDTNRQYRGRVIARLSGGRWSVRDDSRRLAVVTSDQEWRPLVDWVTVQSGRIVGRASAQKKINTYEV